MLTDVANFFLIWFLFFVGGAFAAYYIIGGDLEDSAGLGELSSVTFYIFKTLIGQQEWDKSASVTNDDDPNNNFEVFDVTRSNMLQTLLVFYSIFGTILLLNLLIAMMASSYESVKDRSVQELNREKIDTIYDLDRSRAVITPPFNVLAYLFYVYWFAFEIIAWALTFGHKQFNEEYFSPINHRLTQYSVGDTITFKKSERSLKGKCISKTPKALRNTSTKKLGRASMINPLASQEDFEADLIVEHNGIKYDLRDNQVIKVQKSFFKRRILRVPSLLVENEYCRYCRYNLRDDLMTIDHYLKLFELKGQHIDPDDKQYMRELMALKTGDGVPLPLTCNLCPNCFRPFRVLAKGPDVMNRMMFILEIVSYWVFCVTLRWVLMLILFIPACCQMIFKWIKKRVGSAVSGGKTDQRKTKSRMNMSEENDDYRSKVRQVSKQEEKMDAVVRRIDASVDRLEKTLLGDLIDDDEFEDEIPDHNLRSDEFKIAVDKMKSEIDKKISIIERLLKDAQYED